MTAMNDHDKLRALVEKWREISEAWDALDSGADHAEERRLCADELEAALTQAQPGWRVVPVEATLKMKLAILGCDDLRDCEEGYDRLLAAAPAPQQGEGEG